MAAARHNSARSVDVAGTAMPDSHGRIHSGAERWGRAGGFSALFVRLRGNASDGYQDLSRNMQDGRGSSARRSNGNIALTGEIEVCAAIASSRSRSASAAGVHAALSRMMQTLADALRASMRDRFVAQWKRVGATRLRLAEASTGWRTAVAASAKTSSSRTKTSPTPGAFIASASIPWGASKGDDDLGGYHLVWTRDMVQSTTALLACGRTDDRACARWCIWPARSRPDGGFPQNFWIDGRRVLVAAFSSMRWRFRSCAGVAVVEAGRARRTSTSFVFVERAAALSGAVCPGHAAGAMGGEPGLLAFHARSRDQAR